MNVMVEGRRRIWALKVENPMSVNDMVEVGILHMEGENLADRSSVEAAGG